MIPRLLGRLSTAVIIAASGLAVGAPIAHADCQDNAISPASGGTYSLCTGGQWTHVDRQLCVDYPSSQYCTAPASSTSASPAPVAPPPVVSPPPVGIGVDTPNVPNLNVPNIGCTWVNGYTKRNGTHVSGYWRC
jgi:hypothetical protein